MVMMSAGFPVKNGMTPVLSAMDGFGFDDRVNDIMPGKLLAESFFKVRRIGNLCYDVERCIVVKAVDTSYVKMMNVFDALNFRKMRRKFGDIDIFGSFFEKNIGNLD